MNCLFDHLARLILMFVALFFHGDSYFCLCRPLETNYIGAHCLWWIMFTWVLGIGIGTVQATHSEIRVVHYNESVEFYDCREVWPSKVASHFYTGVIFATSYLLPGLCMALLYWRVGRRIFKAQPRRHTLTLAEIRREQRRKKVKKQTDAKTNWRFERVVKKFEEKIPSEKSGSKIFFPNYLVNFLILFLVNSTIIFSVNLLAEIFFSKFPMILYASLHNHHLLRLLHLT